MKPKVVDYAKLREWLVELYDEKKMSQNILAARTGYSVSQINNYLFSKAPLSLEVLFNLCEAMDAEIKLHKKKKIAGVQLDLIRSLIATEPNMYQKEKETKTNGKQSKTPRRSR